MPHPPILRGIQQVITALRKAGHTVVEWQPYKHKYASELASKVFSADGGTAMRRVLALSDEPVISNMKKGLELNLPIIDLISFWKLQTDTYTYQKEYLALWQQHPHIDGWILPVAPHAAVKHNDYKYYGYTGVLNVLDWPAVAIPVTFADKKKDIKDK
jgi:amidase